MHEARVNVTFEVSIVLSMMVEEDYHHHDSVVSAVQAARAAWSLEWENKL